MPSNEISFKNFLKVDLRAGTIVKAELFKEAVKPAYILYVDLGDELGIKKSSAQITSLYKITELVGKQVLCVCNFPNKQIGPIQSEVLVTGFVLNEGSVVLATADKSVPNGTRLL
jgi:tRNA-binding protein